MEEKIIFYIVSIIIYFIYSANKASKKRKALQEQKNYAPPKQSWEEELKEMLQKTISPQSERRETYSEEEEEYEVPLDVVPVKEEALDTVPKKSAASTYEEQKAYDWAMYKGQEMYSVETDTATLATHVAELEAAMEKKPEGPSVALSMVENEGFDARKAFLFSEIFRAPYLEDLRY
ncbi:MAG TPA: hypothetical protein DIW47_05065 [Bacteroidetes bacterium]|nr:hypothetical protein [Bacteroidota bacterium]